MILSIFEFKYVCSMNTYPVFQRLFNTDRISFVAMCWPKTFFSNVSFNFVTFLVVHTEWHCSPNKRLEISLGKYHEITETQ